MMSAVTIDVRGIKCDNPTCAYEDLEVDFDSDKFLNMPCPDCGSNLLTPEDYTLMQLMLNTADLANTTFKNVDLSGDATMAVTLDMNGTGSLNIGAITGRSRGTK